MTNATMHRNFNPGRSPLLGVAAVVATAVTLGIAVLLPATHTPVEPSVTTAADVQARNQIVTLPAVEVTATRATKSAAGNQWIVPAALKQKS
jgi:hypothetical protein